MSYRRIARRRGKQRAIVALGRAILVIIWHLLEDPQARFHDLGPDHFSRHTNPDARKNNHIRQLEALGYNVTLTPAAKTTRPMHYRRQTRHRIPLHAPNKRMTPHFRTGSSRVSGRWERKSCYLAGEDVQGR